MLTRVVAWSAFFVWLRSYWRDSVWFGPVLIAAMLTGVVVFGHSEYLDFAAASQVTRHIALSFAVKWGLIAVIALITIGVILRNRRRKSRSPAPRTEHVQVENDSPPPGVDFDRPRSAAERILDESPR